jgi:hypothetical protein
VMLWIQMTPESHALVDTGMLVFFALAL